MIVPDINLLIYAHKPDAHDHITPINPGHGHMRLFQNLAVAGSGTKLVTDAHIAALAMEHDAELHTNDSDFARFPGLRWLNPLA